MPRLLLRCLLLCWLALLAGCPKSGDERNGLEKAQYAWSAAIRWGDFEGAWNLVDPKLREQHPLTDLDFSRYKQVQISGYRELGMTGLQGGGVARSIEIGVVNRNTMAERTVRYQETWRYDEATKAWWETSGLPDLWQGE